MTAATTRPPPLRTRTTYKAYGMLQVPAHDKALGRVTERPTTPEGRERLACQYAALVFHIARKIDAAGWARGWGQLEDLFQQGMTALLHAVDHWDAGRGVKFISYAYSCVWQHLRRAVNTQLLVHTPDHLNNTPEDELDEKFSRAVVAAYRQAKNVKGLAAVTRGDGEYEPADDSLSDVEFAQSIEEVRNALRTLNAREADVVARRLGLFDSEEETLERIGDSYGISRERARQIEAKALAKLRNWLMERDPEECETQVARSKMFTTQLVPHAVDAVAARVAPEPREDDA